MTRLYSCCFLLKNFSTISLKEVDKPQKIHRKSIGYSSHYSCRGQIIWTNLYLPFIASVGIGNRVISTCGIFTTKEDSTRVNIIVDDKNITCLKHLYVLSHLLHHQIS